MSGTIESAAGTVTAVQASPGVFHYTVSLTDTGNAAIGRSRPSAQGMRP